MWPNETIKLQQGTNVNSTHVRLTCMPMTLNFMCRHLLQLALSFWTLPYFGPAYLLTVLPTQFSLRDTMGHSVNFNFLLSLAVTQSVYFRAIKLPKITFYSKRNWTAESLTRIGFRRSASPNFSTTTLFNVETVWQEFQSLFNEMLESHVVSWRGILYLS